MTLNQRIWSQAKDRLVEAVQSAGFPAEFGELMARQLGSPRAIDRMTSYIYQAHPHTEEMLADEMLAILSDRDHIREKHEAEYAQAKINELYRDINE